MRKFGAEPPEEWVTAIAMLTAGQHERGLRRVIFGWKGPPPSLPDFMRLCRSIGDELDEGPKPERLPAPETFFGDVWDTAANKYLLGHLTQQLKIDPKRYGQPASTRAMSADVDHLRVLGITDRKNLDASPEFVANVALLVEAKRCWAVDMRALGMEVDPAVQIANWRMHVDAAEREIDVRMGRKAA